MGYLYLFTAVAFGLTKGFLGKKISNKTPTVRSSVMTNLVRMLFCIAVGLAFALFEIKGQISALLVNGNVALIALGAGAATCVFIVSWLLSVRESAYMSVEAFIAMGVLVPTLLSALVYGEAVGASQIIGLVLLLVAVFAMSVYSGQIKGKFTFKSAALLTCTGVSAGLTDFLQKVYVNAPSGVGASTFNLYLYVFSAILLAAVLLVWKKSKADIEPGPSMDRKKLLFIAIMAVCLFCNSLFKTMAARFLPAVLLYPMCQGLALILSMLMSAFLFKERLKPVCIIGISVMFVGLLFINVISF